MVDDKKQDNGNGGDAPEETFEDRRGDFVGVELEHPVEVVATADSKDLHVVAPEDLFLAVRSVLEQGYRLLSCLSGYDSGQAIGCFYAFLKPTDTPEGFGEFRLRSEVPKPEDKEEAKEYTPVLPSIVDLCPAADWQEREAYDMYGIRFEGHPDLRRMFLPDDWSGFPMRKDYSEPEQFVAMDDGEDIVLKTQEEGSW